MVTVNRRPWGRWRRKQLGVMGVSQPVRLVVDPARALRGAGAVRGQRCSGSGRAGLRDLVCSAIGADGYGRFWLRRGGTRVMVRANRYALAATLNGGALEPWVRALHGCDNPICVRASQPGELGLLHVIAGSQRDNMVMMARAGRGGGRVVVRRGDHGLNARRARAVALREAVRHGWDAEAVEAALLGSTDPTLW